MSAKKVAKKVTKVQKKTSRQKPEVLAEEPVVHPNIHPHNLRYNGGVKPQPEGAACRYSDRQGLPCGCKPPN